MPELPEVERAAKLLRGVAQHNEIVDVEAAEDTIVYSGTTHTEFAQTVKGRTVKDVARYGKVFYMVLSGDGKMPVMHFGMTGMLQIKGQLATYYKETPRKASVDWPPRFMKFILHIKHRTTGEVTQVAFLDARRLGRIRLCASPLGELPISSLGFDPILSMPKLEEFTPLVLKRSCPIKALLLDQSFSAGVGNWIADEILYHSRIHPERRCNTLTEEELAALHHHTQHVCRVAVEANADDTKFPEDWLFKHRWGKGKKQKHTLLLPSGEPASIKWVTVGGRTSAFVAELQHPSGAGSTEPDKAAERKGKRKTKSKYWKDSARDGDVDAGEIEGDSDLTSLASEDEESTQKESKPKSTKRKVSPVETTRRSTRQRTERAVQKVKEAAATRPKKRTTRKT